MRELFLASRLMGVLLLASACPKPSSVAADAGTDSGIAARRSQPMRFHGWIVPRAANESLRAPQPIALEPMGETALARPPPGREVTVPEAWEHAYVLDDQLGTSEVEPLFSVSSSGLCGNYDERDGRAHPRWQIDAVHARDAWAVPAPPGGHARGQGAVVCHLDTGVTHHAFIRDGLLDGGLNFNERDAGRPTPGAWDPLTHDPHDMISSAGHGTSTSSMVLGPDGVAPAARVLPFRVTSSVWLSAPEHQRNVADGIDEAVRRGCHVISMSLGKILAEHQMRRAVTEAAQAGVIVVAAAGNCTGSVTVPGDYFPEVFAVSASAQNGNRWYHSADGTSVAITAPGDTVWDAKTIFDGDGGYTEEQSSGTSYATAITASAAALWISFHGWDALAARYGAAGVPRAFRWLLKNRAWSPGAWDSDRYLMGPGILDAQKLLASPLPTRQQVERETPAVRSLSVAEANAERLQHLLRTDAAGVPGTLARLLHVDPAAARAAAQTFPAELGFHIATQLFDEAQADRFETNAFVADAARPTDALRRRVMRDGSPRLKKLLKL